MSRLDINLGNDVVSGEPIILSTASRLFNTIIKGPVGTGKKIKFLMPMIERDLIAIKYKNDNPDSSTEEVYLNGMTIFDSGDGFSEQVMQLANQYDFPMELIHVIDPENPNTASIDIMKGEANEVADVLIELTSLLASSFKVDESSIQIRQIRNNHLKHYILLLKIHDPKIIVTFDMLLNMYRDTNLVHEMHMKLKQQLLKEIDSMDNKTTNYWNTCRSVDQWLDNFIVPCENQENRKNNYVDKFEHFTMGLRNILSDLAENEGLRKLLFRDSGFSFEDHVNGKGGIVIVNTRKGIYEELSSVIGKILLLKLSNAGVNRNTTSNGYHHVVINDSLDFMNHTFLLALSISRRTKLFSTCVLDDNYACENIDESFISNFRNCVEFNIKEFGVEMPWRCHFIEGYRGNYYYLS